MKLNQHKLRYLFFRMITEDDQGKWIDDKDIRADRAFFLIHDQLEAAAEMAGLEWVPAEVFHLTEEEKELIGA